LEGKVGFPLSSRTVPCINVTGKVGDHFLGFGMVEYAQTRMSIRPSKKNSLT